LGQWEPLNALFANNNGLAEYMIISRSLSKVMKTSGVALFEIGYNQAKLYQKFLKIVDIRPQLSKICLVRIGS
jgi:methylase of polypeptide subunit release factors